MRLVLNI